MENKIKNALSSIIVVIFYTGIVYLSLSFLFWDINVYNNILARIVLLTFFIIFSLYIINKYH